MGLSVTRSQDKAKRDYVRGWESASRRPYLHKNVPPTNQRKRLGLKLRLSELWERDRLGVLGVCCAILAAALIVLPADVRWERESNWTVVSPSSSPINSNYNSPERGFMIFPDSGYTTKWFTVERLPAASVFAFAALTLLLLRRR